MKDFVNRVNILINSQQWEEAAALCHQALNLQPDFAPAYKTMGVILQLQGQPEEAKSWYDKALKIQPDFAEVYGNLGSLYASQHRWDEAIKSYETALNLQPNLAGVYRNLARIWQNKNQPEKAANCRYEAFRLEPKKLSLQDYFSLGETWWQQNQFDRLIELYSQAVKFYPNEGKIYYFLGKALAEQQRWEDAILNYQKAVEFHPNTNHYYNSFGDALTQLKRWDEAIGCYLKSIEIDANFCWSYFKLADAYFESEQWENAVNTYRRGLQLNPEHYWPYIKMGDALTVQNQIEDAIAFYRQAQNMNPNLPTSYYKLADILPEIDRENEAITLYKKALEIDSNLSFIYARYGELLEAKARWKEAADLYKKALKFTPNLYEFYFKLGRAFKQQKLWDDAIDSQIKALEIKPHSFEAYDELADIFEYQGHPETAMICRHYRLIPPIVIETFCQYPKDQVVSLNSAADVITIHFYEESVIKCSPPITLDGKIDEGFQHDCFKSPGAFVSILPEGQGLADPILTSAVLNSKSQLIPELSTGIPEFLLSDNHPYSLLELDETAAFLSVRWGNGGFFHWMFDVVARLDLVEKIAEMKNIKIDKFVLTHCPNQSQIDCLEAFGVSADKIIESFHHPRLKAKQLIVPNIVLEFGISEWKVNYLRKGLLNPKIKPEIPGYKRIYIDRNRAGYRHTINNEATVQLLEKYGFQRIYLEALSPVEQAHYLNAAEVVVAPHGAGLTNLTFCNPGTKVIEIFSPGYVTPLYWFLSNICRLEHYYLFGDRLPDDDNPKVSPVTRNICVNLPQLQKLLKKAGL